MADKKPQCEHKVSRTTGNWTRSSQCECKASTNIDGRNLCTQHAALARTVGHMDVVTGKRAYGGVEWEQLDVERDPRLVSSERERQRQGERDRNEKSPYMQQAKYRRIATMAIARLQANGIDADDLAGWMTAHPDDVPEGR